MYPRAKNWYKIKQNARSKYHNLLIVFEEAAPYLDLSHSKLLGCIQPFRYAHAAFGLYHYGSKSKLQESTPICCSLWTFFTGFNINDHVKIPSKLQLRTLMRAIIHR